MLQTVAELQGVMTTHPDVGVAMTIQNAIRHAKEKKGLTSENALDATSLEKIRQSIYDLNNMEREDADPMMTLFNAMLSTHTSQGKGSGNTVDDALNYIENLQRQQ
ncbi:MAG TPA: hypothetical protein VFI61_03420 [Patescibacteria group bacterium]|nr:hypothetical protein [Patescibacteria group bacterium]